MQNQEVPTSNRLPRWLIWLLGLGAIAGVAIVVLIAIAFYSLFLIFAPDEYAFPSPSGTKTLILSESCFSIACDYTARVEVHTDDGTQQLDCELGLRGDGSKFDRAVVTWNEDEQAVRWQSGALGGEITIATDCQ